MHTFSRYYIFVIVNRVPDGNFSQFVADVDVAELG